jgi:hypothetical protein
MLVLDRSGSGGKYYLGLGVRQLATDFVVPADT